RSNLRRPSESVLYDRPMRIALLGPGDEHVVLAAPIFRPSAHGSLDNEVPVERRPYDRVGPNTSCLASGVAKARPAELLAQRGLERKRLRVLVVETLAA